MDASELLYKTVDLLVEAELALAKTRETVADLQVELAGKRAQAQEDSLASMAREVHETAVSKGWWDNPVPEALIQELLNLFSRGTIKKDDIIEAVAKHWPRRNVGEMMMLWVTEIAEAYEEYRKGRLDDTYAVDGKPEGGVIEVADLVIRILDTSHDRDWNLGYAIRKKMDYNKTRPYRHGGKLS